MPKNNRQLNWASKGDRKSIVFDSGKMCFFTRKHNIPLEITFKENRGVWWSRIPIKVLGILE